MASDEENFYGAGERAININHRGMRLNSYNAPWYGYSYGASNLNITVPFVLSSKPYGIYFENTYPGYFDFGYSNSNIFEYGISGGQFSYFIINGNSFPEILTHYVDLTGHQPLPPRWTLGYLQSRFGYQSQNEAQQVVNTFQDREIPLDAIILDLYWFGWGQMGDMDWDYSAWPDPQGMISGFDSLGVKTVLISEPYVLQSSDNFSIAYNHGYLTPNSSGTPVIVWAFWAGPAGLLDVTDPSTVDWWWDFYENLQNQGVGGWWCDLGEPEAHPPEMVHYLGSAEEIHNIYSLLWAKMIYNKTKDVLPNNRLFNLIRSGYAGIQRFSVFPWSGDVQRSYSGLRAQAPIMLGMGLSGIGYMHSDIGGFTGGYQDPELYTGYSGLFVQ
ncbi:MAG: hypothetical protein H8E14_03130 [Candidatus Marinimicrobia bacterium]|nr:hypothetical protein [Candidatus Neomarinimicrobiota bacterium]